jgi:flagellin-specific chaperone FliS
MAKKKQTYVLEDEDVVEVKQSDNLVDLADEIFALEDTIMSIDKRKKKEISDNMDKLYSLMSKYNEKVGEKQFKIPK